MIAWYWFIPLLVIFSILSFFLGAFVASAGAAGQRIDELNAAEERRQRESQARLN